MIDKFLDLDRDLNKLWNMKVIVILSAVGSLGLVTIDLEKRLEKLESREKIDTIQTIALLKSTRILRRVLNPEETCCHLDFSKKQLIKICMKNSHSVKQ